MIRQHRLENASPVRLSDGSELSAEWSADGQAPAHLRLRVLVDGLATRQLQTRLDPPMLDGFECHKWRDARGAILVGADCMIALDLRALAIAARIPLEVDELERKGLPWVHATADDLLVATETRIFLFDGGMAVRWQWSTRVMSADSWVVASAPELADGKVHVVVSRLLTTRALVLDPEAAERRLDRQRHSGGSGERA